MNTDAKIVTRQRIGMAEKTSILDPFEMLKQSQYDTALMYAPVRILMNFSERLSAETRSVLPGLPDLTLRPVGYITFSALYSHDEKDPGTA